MQSNELDMARNSMSEIIEAARGKSLVDALRKEYWLDFLAEDEELAVASLFEAQGRKLSPETGLSMLALHVLGEEMQDASLVLPSTATGGASTSGTITGEHLSIDGLIFASGTGPIIAPASSSDGVVNVYELQGLDSSLSHLEISGIDADLNMSRFRCKVLSSCCAKLSLDWGAAEAATRRALAYELVALSEAMLEKTGEHVRERKQFGRPLGSFQSVRNSLADLYVAITGSRDMIHIAFQEKDGFSAMVAKAQAGQTALLAARHCQQFCGAMGWTWEFGLHNYIRRAQLLDSLLGSSAELVKAVGNHIASAGRASAFATESIG